MCKFFSICSNGRGKYLYFDWVRRKELLASNPDDLSPDSHSSIATEFEAVEDKLNKYEYNPLTGAFEADQINNSRDDHIAAEKWVRKLDFKRIVEPLIIKPIVHPFRDVHRVDVTPDEIELLRQWASVRDSVWDSVRDSVWDSVRASVWASVRDSVGDSVRASVWASVGDSVWASVGDSVRDSVWDSVGDSVGDSVRASVWASVWAYVSSFFNIKYQYDFSSCVKLWEAGLVPSFDGITYRLHGNTDARVLHEWTPVES